MIREARVNDNKDEPIRLIEDAATGDRFLVYGTRNGIELDIRFEGETLWMSQAQIADLFGKDVSTVSRHINNVLEEGELDESSSLQKVQTTVGRPTILYSLDMIISVGYRVSSAQATLFRRWATGILVQYAKKGFVVDARRLKSRENRDRIKELRDIIRDLRSDEANLYAELQDICALCQDYDGSREAETHFFQHMQAKMVFAAVSYTPSEILLARADHRAANMGLQSWHGDNIRKSDVRVSKNYLAETEIRDLNRLTDLLLSLFEIQLEDGKLVTMQDAKDLLDKQLKQMSRSVLSSGGSVGRDQAIAHAESEYAQFDAERKSAKRALAKEQMAALKAEAMKLPKGR
jgi:hypothetical protein